MDKKQLRATIKQQLAQMSEKQITRQSGDITNNLTETDCFKKASVVMTFLSLPTEVNTAALILKCWQMGKAVAVPKVSWEQRHMIPVIITSMETGLSTDMRGLKNPVTGVPTPIEEIDLVITPGLAFDKTGKRLGRGGGYFDRFFANKSLRAVKCGVCFHQQITDDVPTDETDVPIDCLVTDKQVYYFNE